MKKFMAYGLAVFFGCNQMALAKNSENWQPLMVEGGSIFIDTHSIKTVFPPAKLKPQYTGEYKIVKVKLPSEQDTTIFDFQIDCKNSLIGFYGITSYNKEDKLINKDYWALFDEQTVWDEIKPSGQVDYQIYRYVCQGVTSNLTQ